MKSTLSASETKAKWIQSVFDMMMRAMDASGKSEFKGCFAIEGSSIICNLPKDDTFGMYSIPENTKIEMKFITKKN